MGDKDFRKYVNAQGNGGAVFYGKNGKVVADTRKKKGGVVGNKKKK